MTREFKPALRTALVALIAGAVFGFGFGGSSQPVYSASAYLNTADRTITLPDSPLLQATTTVEDPQTEILHSIYAKVNPSVVSIEVRTPATTSAPAPRANPSQNAPQQYQYGAGSGWVYDANGHIVTNTHVVENADRITVTFSDGTQFRATVVGIDQDSDLAVIKITGDASAYKPLTLADSDKVQVGDRAIAIGNPFERAGTMTHGIISAVGRSVSGNGEQRYVIPNAIQTDAAINPGNSGGPLLNTAGEVIGVNQQIAAEVRQSSGVSFAIPANLVKKVAAQLIATGKMEHSYLGIAGGTLTLDLVEALKLPAGTRGAYVSQVTANSPAAKAGLKAGTQTLQTTDGEFLLGGDVIIGVEGKTVRTFEDLTGYLFLRTEPGQAVTLQVLRAGQEVTLNVTLAARPKAQSQG